LASSYAACEKPRLAAVASAPAALRGEVGMGKRTPSSPRVAIAQHRVKMAASGASVAAGSVEAKLPPHEQVCAEWEKHIKAILFDSRQIAQRVKELGEQISRDYAGKKVLAVGLLTGCFVFMADLMRHIARPHEIDFMVVSSYGKGTASSGNVKLKKDCSIDPAGQHVLIIEDLIDSGRTLQWIRKHLESKGCASIRVSVCERASASRGCG
jgi:hypoxanthine phosphoribosyltransferase